MKPKRFIRLTTPGYWKKYLELSDEWTLYSKQGDTRSLVLVRDGFTYKLGDYTNDVFCGLSLDKYLLPFLKYLLADLEQES